MGLPRNGLKTCRCLRNFKGIILWVRLGALRVEVLNHQMSYSLNSLKGGYIGGYIWDCYRGY